MAQLAFDTLSYSKILQNVGIPQEQADAFAAAQKNALDQMVATAELATKKDIVETELRLSDRINASQRDIIKWFVGIALAEIAIIVAVIGIVVK